MRVVLDNNILISALPSRSKFHIIYKALLEGKYDLLITADIYLEYLEIMLLKSNAIIVNDFVSFIFNQPNIKQVEVYFFWNLITVDPDDNKYTDCAIAGQADYLVSNDAHFRTVKSLPFPPLRIITAEEFVAILKNQSSE